MLRPESKAAAWLQPAAQCPGSPPRAALPKNPNGAPRQPRFGADHLAGHRPSAGPERLGPLHWAGQTVPWSNGRLGQVTRHCRRQRLTSAAQRHCGAETETEHPEGRDQIP